MKPNVLFAALALSFALPSLPYAQTSVLPPAATTTQSVELSRLSQLGPRALRENSPLFLRRAVLADLFKVALEAEILAAQGLRVEAAQRYAVIARASDDPAAAQRASELAASSDNLPLAREMAKRWAELDETSTRAREVSSALALADGDLTRALEGLMSTLPREPEARSKAIVDLARSLIRSQPSTQAVSVMRALSAKEKTAAAYFGLAMTEFAASIPPSIPGTRVPTQKQDLSAVFGATARALALDPNFAPAAAMQAEVIGRDDPKAARAFAEDYLRRNPKGKEVRAFLAQKLADAKEYDAARTQFLIVADESDERAKAEATFAAALLALRLKTPEQALTELESLDGNAFANQSVVRFYKGQALEAVKRYADAITQWDGVERDAATWKEAQWRSANALAKLGKIDEARAYLDNQLGDDENADVGIAIIQSHAGWLREAGRLDAALKVLDDALARTPTQTDLLYDSAMIADRMKRFDEMERRFRSVIAIKPDNAQALNALAFSFAERNIKIAEARGFIDRAIALAPEDAAIMDSVAWVYFREGKLVESEQWLRKAYAKFADGEVAAHLAEVLIAQNRRDDAREVLQKFPSDGSNANLAQEALKRFFAQ